VWLCSIGKWFT